MAGLSAPFEALFFPGGRFFYGWNIVGAAGGLQMLAGMLWMQSYGAYVVFLKRNSAGVKPSLPPRLR